MVISLQLTCNQLVLRLRLVKCHYQGYRTLTALVARPWCLVEILAKEEIINIVTDATTETAKIGKPSNTPLAIGLAFFFINLFDL